MAQKFLAFDAFDLVMSATSYYLGRRTIAVDEFCRSLAESWHDLPANVQLYVTRIVEEAYSANRLGDECDKKSWDGVRALWRDVSK